MLSSLPKMSEKLQEELDMVDIKDTLVEIPVETNDDYIKNEIDMNEFSCENENLEPGVSKSSRELKLLLALSKEANLDTNIGHKRKSIESVGKVAEKSKPNNKILSTAEPVDNQPQSRSIIRVDYKKSEIDCPESQETKDSCKIKVNINTQENLNDASTEEVSDGDEKSSKIMSSNVVVIINHKRKDPFCWRCHHEKPTFFCETCPRSFHQKCLKHGVLEAEHWICPVCTAILKAENLKQRSPALREMSLEHFCGLLKFALKRMMQVEGYEPFIQPVNEADFPDYKKYVAQPMDLTSLERNIKNNIYGSPEAFEADAQWILHNSIIFNSYQSKFTSVAKSMMKICRQEMAEIENCASCYLNANTKKKTWFVEVCPKPHMVVWAKLKGFPYWPAKAMRTNSVGMVDVRFFGAHDRAWVPSKDCFLYCTQDPNSNKQKRHDINESIKELNIYIENLKRIYGEFRYAPYRLVLDPDDEIKQLKILLPKYDPEKKFEPGRGFRKSLHRNGNCSPNSEEDEDNTSVPIKTDEDFIDESEPNPSSDCSPSGTSSDDSSNFSNPLGHSTSVRMRGGLINTSGRIKVIPKASPFRKRQLFDGLHDSPPKLFRHDSDETMNQSDGDSTDTELSSTPNEDLNIVNEDECPKLTDETKVIEESPVKPSITDRLLKKLSDLIDEPFEKSKIVAETDLLLNTIDKKSNPIIENQPDSDLPLDLDITDNASVQHNVPLPSTEIKENLETVDVVEETSVSQKPTENVGSVVVMETPSNKTADPPTIGTVEVIEVNITESIESADQMELEIPVNIQDIVQASDISTVSISTVEPDIDIFNENIVKPSEEKPLPIISSSSRESLEQNVNSNSSVEDYTNPLDFVEVTESTPLDERLDMEDELMSTEKMEDILQVSVPSAGLHEQNEAVSEIQQSNKRRRSCDKTDTMNGDENLHLKKSLRLVNINDIRKKILDATTTSPLTSEPVESLTPALEINSDSTTSEPLKSLQSLLEKQLLIPSKSSENINNAESVVIKSEPNSEDELNDAEYMELKRRYLSALNISERLPQPPKKPISMRTRSKSEENKIKLADNLTKVIDDVATRTALTREVEDTASKNNPLKRKEIFVKPLAKMQMPKQKARKSFPMPIRNVYPAQSQKKDVVRLTKSIVPTNTSTVRTTTSVKPSDSFTTSNNIVYIAHSPSASGSLALLPPNQPITYTGNRGNPILTMVQHPPNYLSASNKSASDRYESQNYIPLSGEVPKPRSTNTHPKLTLTTVVEGIATTSINQMSSIVTTPSTAPSTVTSSTSATVDVLEGLGTLTSLIPDTLSKTIGDIMCRAPPRLKPRPPGPLSRHFDEGLPSSAGTVSSRVNSISHRLGDYFRGMLIELLHEMSTSDNLEAEITQLKLENEELKHKHNEEIIEIKKNISTILKDVQKSIEDERNRIVEETRSACEAECVKRVEEAKSKQWCANCSKEAQFYCCWNTSYCDFPCQEKHWPKHMSKCTQNIQNSRPLSSSTSSITHNTNNTTAIRPAQPIVLRQTAPPKTFTAVSYKNTKLCNDTNTLQKALIAKPTKVIVNRSAGTKNAISYVRTTSGNHITLVESTPGNYELVGNGGPISVGGKFITGFGKIRGGNIISVPSTSSSASTALTGNTQKAVIISQAKPVQPTTTTVISDDEYE